MRSIFGFASVLLVCLFAKASVAFAQSEDEAELAQIYGDKGTVSIATGSKQQLRRAPAVATVITAEDIAAMGATDLDQVLETVPGLHVGRAPNTYSSLYLMHGIVSAYTPQVLVLQNGIPMTTLFTGNRGNIWGGFPVEHIARIEVMRGPGSALYGADAFSGVINIITKTAADTHGTEVGMRAGSFADRDVWVQHGGSLGPMDVAAYLGVGRTDGFKRIVDADAQTRNDTSFGTKSSLAPGPVNVGYDAVNANLDLGLGKWHMRAGYKLLDNVGTGAGIASALDPVGKGKSERITADLSWNDPQFSQDWGTGFTASYMQYTQLIPSYLQLFPPGTRFPTGSFPDGMIGAPQTWERQMRLSAYAAYFGWEGHRLRFGIGHDDLDLYKIEEYKNFIFTPGGVPVPAGGVTQYMGDQAFMTPQRRKVDYFYMQDEWQLARDWSLTAGIRHDRYSDFGGTTNPRAALVWDAALDLTVKLLVGRAFRAPSFSEQYSINNPVVRGNPNLRPETVRTTEAAFSWQTTKDLQANLSLFHYAMQDIIRTVPNATPGTGATYSNTGSQHGSGMELEMVWDASRNLRLTGNYAYQRSIDESTNQDAGYAPHHHLYARADWRLAGGWMLSPQINWVADRRRAAGDNRPPVPDYTTVDIALRTGYGNRKWDFAAGVRNLFDADVREPSPAPGLAIPNDLPMAPRAFYLQAIYRM